MNFREQNGNADRPDVDVDGFVKIEVHSVPAGER